MDAASLADLLLLPGVTAARAILREAFRLELGVTSDAGPPAHQNGGVMAASSEACRVSLFTREGFARCDAFYRALGTERGAGSRSCHLGLAAMHVPVVVEGETLAQVFASGFGANALRGCAAPDPGRLAADLRALDPNLGDPGEAARHLPIVRNDRVEIVRAVLTVAAREMAEHEEDRRRRGKSGGAGGLPGAFGIIGRSARMRDVFDQIRRVAASHATALVAGESGTGKELVARAIHDLSPRAGAPFVAQSCAAMPDDLLETTLFGHVRGAFSGAVRTSDGLFGAARGGTLFLDEVGEMSPAMQGKLLRVLAEGTYLPVGATSPRKADVRVVAASHRDLAAMVEQGTLRQDLFYRLHVLPISLPPLRDRAGDLPLLVDHFLAAIPDAPRRVEASAQACLDRYAWPGNVRELRAEIERWSVVARGARAVGPEHLSNAIREAGGYAAPDRGAPGATGAAPEPAGTLAQAVEAVERTLLARGLERTGGNRTQLAKDLAISRTTLNERLKRYGLG